MSVLRLDRHRGRALSETPKDVKRTTSALSLEVGGVMSSHKLTLSNQTLTPNQGLGLLVTGWRGSDLGSSVQVGTVITPQQSVTIATAQSGAGDQWDWVYLLDLNTNTQYQIYWESNSGGHVYASFGYYDPSSSESKSNPSPFPPSFSKVNTGNDVTYILLATPPAAPTTDIQALTDHLAYLLVGSNFVYSASVDYDTKAHPELAPYISNEVQVSKGGLIFDPQSTARTVPIQTMSNTSGCYDNASTTEDLNETQTFTRTDTTTVTITLAEALTISEEYSEQENVPGIGTETTKLSVSFTITKTSAQSDSQTHTWAFTPTISIPPSRSANWDFIVNEVSVTLGFTVPVLFQGSVAIRSKADLTVVQAFGVGATTTPIQGSTDYLIVAPFGSLVKMLGVRQLLGNLKFSFQANDTAAYNLRGLIYTNPAFEYTSTMTLLPSGTTCASSLPA